MKCLPSTKLPLCHGNVLHDWHAEILTIRTFNRFLLDQCLLISTPPYPSSPWIKHSTPLEKGNLDAQNEGIQPFTIPPDVTIHIYCSEAPCGDASMELTMSSQADSTPWTSAPPTISPPIPTPSLSQSEAAALRGRANFDRLGTVRLKPSRPDAPPTLSKSCTDKLALRQAFSLLSATTSLLVSPRNAYINTLVLPESQFVRAACERAFSRSGRMKGVSDEMIGTWGGGYKWNEFSVAPTRREFEWSRRCVKAGEKAVASNLSAIWSPGWQETLIGGVLQGRKQFDARGASAVCRRGMLSVAVRVAALVGVSAAGRVLGKRRYEDVKSDGVFDERKRVKRDVIEGGLKGWMTNVGDDNWGLED